MCQNKKTYHTNLTLVKMFLRDAVKKTFFNVIKRM